MIRNTDLAYTLRKFRNNKLLALFSIIGLTVGITCFLLVALVVRFEISFNRFQQDGERVFRVYSELKGPVEQTIPGAPAVLYLKMKEEFTGLESITNFQTFRAPVAVISASGSTINFGEYDRTIIARPDYFEVFNYYEWIIGDPKTSLGKPFNVVITENRAKQFFGDMSPAEYIGRELYYTDSLRLTISGIIRDINDRTDLDFTDFISFDTIEKSWLRHLYPLNSWTSVSSSSQLFFKVMPNTTIAAIERQMPLLYRIFAATYRNEWNNSPKFQRLDEMHFDTELGIFNHSRSVPEKSTILMLSGIASLILVSALINFVNLATADNSKRAKEIAIRKVLGSSRWEIALQFFFETSLLIVAAVTCSLCLIGLLVRNFTSYLPEGFTYSPTEPVVAIGLLLFIFVLTLLTAWYPSFVLTSYAPASALKNLHYVRRNESVFIRRGLTVLQFTCSQVLILLTIVIGLQVDFLLNKDLGFSSHQIVYFYTPWRESPAKQLILKNEIDRISAVQATAIGLPPNSKGGFSTIEFGDGKEMKLYQVSYKEGDDSYLDLYDIQIIAGRNFSANDSANEYLINEKFLNQLGFSSPLQVLGKTINRSYSIIGVVKDFHSKDLYSAIEPIVISKGTSNCIGLRLNEKDPKRLSTILKKLETAWAKTYPNVEFRYWFLETVLKESYKDELRTKLLCIISTFIAVSISCFGLYGLSTLLVARRTKEIGIRKVLGGSNGSIVILLTKEYVGLVLIAFVIGAPIAFYFISEWLNRYAYRIDVHAGVYFSSLLVSIIVAILSVGMRTVNAAKGNPVTALRYE